MSKVSVTVIRMKIKWMDNGPNSLLLWPQFANMNHQFYQFCLRRKIRKMAEEGHCATRVSRSSRGQRQTNTICRDNFKKIDRKWQCRENKIEQKPLTVCDSDVWNSHIRVWDICVRELEYCCWFIMKNEICQFVNLYVKKLKLLLNSWMLDWKWYFHRSVTGFNKLKTTQL